MAVYKDKNGTWYVSARYTNWKGEADRKVKRGFQTKREAAEWEKNFFLENAGNLDMTFEAFYQLYKQNTKDRIKLNTWKMKESVIEGKILPYFRSRRMNEIKPRDVVNWQNTMMKMTDENGKPFSPVYLKTIHNQLSAIFNHAVKFYDLPSNPAAKAGNMGKEKSREMLFWTQAEYQEFAEAMMSKPISFYAFEVLYWAGLRLGELLALKEVTPMNNNVYLIHEEDYIKHINDKMMLYSFVKQFAHHIDKMKPTRANEAIMKMARTYGTIAENLFNSWGIPKSYMVFEDRDDLAELMENELIAPEDAGYYPCDDLPAP